MSQSEYSRAKPIDHVDLGGAIEKRRIRDLTPAEDAEEVELLRDEFKRAHEEAAYLLCTQWRGEEEPN